MDALVALAQLSPQEVLEKFHSTLSGLSTSQAQQRFKQYGPNLVAARSKFFILKLLWESFFSPLVLLLLVASLLASILGDVKDFIIIFSIVILSGGITFSQHFKADHAAEKLKKKVQLFATLIRDGIKKEIPFAHVVPGDIVVLSAGDIVPADGRILEQKDLSVDESTLTGESFPAQKTDVIKHQTTHILSSLTTLVFRGTHVVTGEAMVMVTATGNASQLGKLSEQIIKPKPKTDFDLGIERFSMLLIKVILVLSLFVFGINALLHHELITSFLFAVALAVGLTPELMPVILTINLARGALRMEKKEVIVKYLPAIQNFGSMDVLCTDKTGTLTESTISLVDYYTIEQKKSENVLLFGILASLHTSGVKDPLDRALLSHQHALPIHEYKKIDDLPFDFTRKRSSIVVENKKHTLFITKGAPQKILPICDTYQDGTKNNLLTEKEKNIITRHIELLNKKGLRVLLVASKPIEKRKKYEIADEKKLQLIGYLIFQDPVKTTVGKTVKELEQLGIVVKILTGDNEIVTQKVCTDVGIPVGEILTGEQLDHLSNESLEAKVDETTIFAHLTPEQKARIITLLKKKNHVVGYLGDGVNDAPPLKASDVGISVNNGSDIARDVADIVLMRKSLGILQEGVLEGRKVHTNIFKYILMSLSSNFGNMVTVAAASLFLPFLPLLPVQVLLINFLYDLSQITIPSDNVDKESIEKPQKWNMKFLKKFMIVFGPISSVFDFCTFFGLFFIFHASMPLFRTGWFLESVITQTLIILVIRTKRVPFIKSLPSIPVVISCIVTIFAGIVLTNFRFSPVFSFVHVPIIFYLFLGIIIFAYYTVVEIGKLWFYNVFIR